MATATTQDGVVLHYDSNGNGHGPAFIFAHAYPMNLTIWQPQVTSFLNSWRTVAYDVRGFGRSTAPIDPNCYSQDRSVADLRELLDAIDVEKAVICGLSMGGNIALNFRLVQMPSQVSDYVLLHELMHLKQQNHSRRFWRLVEAVYPMFRDAERWLRTQGKTLF